MASPVPAKSQPLHNFSLPHFKWTKDHTSNNRRCRRPADSSTPADSAQQKSPTSDSAARPQPSLVDSAPRQSPKRDSASDSESGYASEKRENSPPESGKNGFLVSSSDHKIEKSEKKWAPSDVDGAGVKEVRSKIYIRLRTKNKPADVQDEGKTGTEEGELEGSVAKTWNLRPRKPISKPPNANWGPSKVGGSSLQESKGQLQQVMPNRPETNRLRSGPEAEAAEKKGKKQKLSVSLSRHEIEEDIFVMTGSKPARRPKKRAKTVQKQLDNLFPGLWLESITPDLYKVSEAPAKG